MGIAQGQVSGGGGGIIKSIQRGTIVIAAASLTNTATVTSVVTSNASLRHVGATYDTDAAVQGRDTNALIDLTNATTITATRSSTTGSVTVYYELIEYYPGVLKSVQRGSISLNGIVTNTATITSVDPTKSEMHHLGQTTNDANTGEYVARTRSGFTLTNATTVTATRGIGTNLLTVQYEVAEFY